MDSLEGRCLEGTDFLVELDKKLHYVKPVTITPNISKRPFEAGVDCYTDNSMDEKELKQLLEIVEGDNFAIYPINTCMGFAVGFQVAGVKTRKSLLKFKESQLPEGEDFSTLADYFMKPENVKLANSLGVKVINDYDYYDY